MCSFCYHNFAYNQYPLILPTGGPLAFLVRYKYIINTVVHHLLAIPNSQSDAKVVSG